MNLAALSLLLLSAVTWEHPAGMITDATISEVRDKVATQTWAREHVKRMESSVNPWVEKDITEIRRIFPREGGNVYHNFSCPTDRVRLQLDLFNPEQFHCTTCGEDFPPHTDAGIYPVGDRYHGDMYAGWVCLFHNGLSQRMVDMAFLSRLQGKPALKARAIELLLLYAEVLPTLPLRVPESINQNSPMRGQYNRILTYHREGDNTILFNLAQAYELVRDGMSAAQREQVERQVLTRLLEDIMLEPQYIYDHNNVYQWHRTVVQAGLALEREDVIDWAFGQGDYAPEELPEHRSMARILDTHFNADGAFWELASGYHLYPVQHLCEFAVLSRNVSTMDPKRFPAERYDLTRRDSAGGQVIHKALTWFMSLAMPDRTMTILGDSTKARAGMDTYTATAEIGYRYYDIQAVGDYARFREGRRSRHGLLYGAPTVVQHDLPYTSSFLSSGWVSLRNEWEDNQVWVGLNALIKGGGHQHADHLTLTLFAHGQLLALEKSVPYNEATLRVLGTETAAHNTVTVDFESGPQGESLTPEQTPEVVYFHDGPVAKYAEIHGDNLYAQTTVYRRAVAVVEDVVVDCFRVEGGETHDWMVHHGGAAPTLSLDMTDGSFEPKAWLAGGRDAVQTATTDGTWTARWSVADVNSRLTMLGAAATQVFALETYPLNNAVITDAYPPTQSLCVRRKDDAPFVAVWDSWKDTPNLVSVSVGNRPEALLLRTKAHTYHVLFGGGKAVFPDGLEMESDGAFVVVKDRQAMTLVGGTGLTMAQDGNELTLEGETVATVEIRRGNEDITVHPVIAHDTYGGVDHPRPAPSNAGFRMRGTWPAGGVVSE